MDRRRIELAVASGMAFVCATCRKYWQGVDRGLGHCTGQRCGSPLKEMVFPEYDGILTPERFANWCFACGAKSEYGVMVHGSTQLCGVCNRHLVLFHPRNHKRVPNVLLRSPGSVNGASTVTIARFFGPQKRTFAEEVYEVEKHYADKEGRPFDQDQQDGEGET